MANSSSELWSAHYASSFAGGSGTSSAPYLISTAAQFARMAYMVNTSTSYRTKYWKLTADIDLNEYRWVPIGKNSSYYFSGYFDGGGYTISNIYCKYTDTSYVGLFGYVSNSSRYIKNFILKAAKFIGTTNTSYVGNIAGYMTGGTIENIQIDRDTLAAASIMYAKYKGGIVGYTASSNITIKNCNVIDGRFDDLVNVASAKEYQGGVIGYAALSSSSYTLTIQGCNINVDLGGAPTGSSVTTYRGGVIGYLAGGSYGKVYIQNNSCTCTYDVYDQSSDSNVVFYTGSIFGSIATGSSSGYATIYVDHNIINKWEANVRYTELSDNDGYLTGKPLGSYTLTNFTNNLVNKDNLYSDSMNSGLENNGAASNMHVSFSDIATNTYDKDLNKSINLLQSFIAMYFNKTWTYNENDGFAYILNEYYLADNPDARPLYLVILVDYLVFDHWHYSAAEDTNWIYIVVFEEDFLIPAHDVYPFHELTFDIRIFEDEIAGGGSLDSAVTTNTTIHDGEWIYDINQNYVLWGLTDDETKAIKYQKASSTIVEVEAAYYKNSSGNIVNINGYKYKKDSSTVV